MLGFFQLICQLLVLACLVFVVVYPEYDAKLINFDSTQYSPANNLTGLTEKNKHKTSSSCVAFAFTLFAMLLAVMMVCGVIRRRPGYLVPHFILQVFDFCITCLKILGYFTYAPNLRAYLASQSDMPAWLDLIKSTDEWTLALTCMIVLVVLLFIKAYFIGMVWACYKYLMNSTTGDVVRRTSRYADAEQMLLPPKYEDIYSGENPPPLAPVAIPLDTAPPIYTA